jgi:glycosyltransferase involved in cell wall biosynthesis
MERNRTAEVSVVVPLYNERDNVALLCDAIGAALDGWDHDWEVILVDDGSDDGTGEALQAQVANDRRFRAVALRRNSGQTQAMATGFWHSRGSVIVSMDGDLQNDPRDIPRLVARIEEGFDVVCGWRRDRRDPWLTRKLPSRIANRIIARITGIPIHDNGCSLKAYRAEVIRSLNLYSEMHRFLPALSAMTGARIAEVVVRHQRRIHGASKYGILRTFRVMADMVTIKAVTQFSSRPGLYFGILSLPWLALALLCGWVWVVTTLSLEGRGSVILSSLTIMFAYLFGNMIALSFLGEMYLALASRRHLLRLASLLTVESRLPRSADTEPGR